MPKQKTPLAFTKKLKECVVEYRKQFNETRDDTDAAHFFDKSLKKFLKDHEEEVTILSTMNFERPFISWMKSYLLGDGDV